MKTRCGYGRVSTVAEYPVHLKANTITLHSSGFILIYYVVPPISVGPSRNAVPFIRRPQLDPCRRPSAPTPYNAHLFRARNVILEGRFACELRVLIHIGVSADESVANIGSADSVLPVLHAGPQCLDEDAEPLSHVPGTWMCA